MKEFLLEMLLISGTTAALVAPEAFAQSAATLDPKQVAAPRVPKQLSGRKVVATYEAQLAQALTHRVDPVYVGPPAPVKRAPGVVEVYVEISSGMVLFVDVVEAPSALHAKALREAAWKWKFLPGPPGNSGVIVAPFTYYFVSGKDGKTTVVSP